MGGGKPSLRQRRQHAEPKPSYKYTTYDEGDKFVVEFECSAEDLVKYSTSGWTDDFKKLCKVGKPKLDFKVTKEVVLRFWNRDCFISTSTNVGIAKLSTGKS